MIRKSTPLSRAEISRFSGLQRSTVSLIVEELIRDKWILEGSPCRSGPQGSRTFLEFNRNRVVIAIDLRPSQVTLAVIDFGGRVISKRAIVGPLDPNDAVRLIIDATDELLSTHSDRSFDGIGIILSGRTDPANQKLVFPPNTDCPVFLIRSSLREATGLRVEVDNVANACALSEVWYCSSDSGKDMVVVDVSDVIGTGIFANGKVLHGARGMAGEFGHVKIDPAGPLCDCGKRGCWQGVASNLAGLRYYKELNGDIDPQSPDSFASLAKLAQAQNPNAVTAIEKMSLYLGQGLSMITCAISPSEIVIVGEVTSVWYIAGPIVKATLEDNSLSAAPQLRAVIDASSARLRSAVPLVMQGSVI